MNQPPGRPGSNPQRPGSPPPGPPPGGRPGNVPGAPPPPGGYARPQAPPQYQAPQAPQYQPPPDHPGHGYPGAPPPGQPPAPGPAGVAPAMIPPARPRKSRASLRFLASSCIFSGWLTLVVSLLMACGSVVAGMGAQKAANAAATSTQYFPQTPVPSPAPANPEGDIHGIPLPGVGGDGGIFGGAAGSSPRPSLNFDFLSMFRSYLTPLYFITAGFTLLTGIVSCLLFLGLGQACYVLLDLEDQTHQITQTLHLISSRLIR